MKGEDIIVLFAHGDLEKGLYEGRFQFKLPQNARASCYWEMNEHENMPFLKIKYRLCATLDRREGDKPLRYNTSLMVHEAPDEIPKKNRNQ
jgi:hypothetical protein